MSQHHGSLNTTWHQYLTISSLNELDDVLDKLTPKQYEKLYKNTVQVAKMMRQGAFMQKAINSDTVKLPHPLSIF